MFDESGIRLIEINQKAKDGILYTREENYMNPILVFLVFPLATIVFSIALEKILNSPFLVSAIIFSIFLILAFTAFTTTFIINSVIYALIALITAFLYRIIRRIIDRINDRNSDNENNNGNNNNTPNTNACRTCCCQRQFCRCMRGIQ